MTASLDLYKAKRVMQAQKRVNVDFPTWMVESLDREASKLGGLKAACDQNLVSRAAGSHFLKFATTTNTHCHSALLTFKFVLTRGDT